MKLFGLDKVDELNTKDDEIDQLRVENAKLREALKAVEWVEFITPEGDIIHYCEGCHNLYEEGHTDTCIIGNALKGGQNG